jgi:hypothetical protein
VAVIALSATALMGVAVSAASAAPANIDPDEARSLTIHKLSMPETPGAAGDGSEVPSGSLPAGSLPINGVAFTVREVTEIGGVAVDLETDAGWALIQPYLDGTTPFVPSGATLGAGVVRTTANGGIAVFDTLPVGLFYVTETSAGSNSIAAPAQPFLVTLPMPTTEPGVFRYDVHAYPKNVLGDEPYMVKTVDDSTAYAVGDKVTWTISTRVPDSSGYAVATFGVYEMPNVEALARWDDTKVWSANDGTQFPDRATVTPKGGTPVVLYPEDLASASNPVPVTELSDSGLAKVNAAGPGSIIEFVYETRVQAIPANGEIDNQAEVAMDGINKFVGAESLWGTARVNKHAQGDEDARLAGAEFQVFATEAAANAAAAQVAAGDPVTGGLEFGAGSTAGADRKTFTTADQGADHGFVVINGLKASAAGTKYWVVETKAPAGYVAAAAPTEITVYPGTGLTGSGSVANVPNQMRKAGALPVLGGAGMTAIGVAGAILIAGGVLFAVLGRRKQTTPTASA